jgi:hypothetical protein
VTDVVEQELRLHAEYDLGGRVPPTAVGEVLRLIEPAVRKSVRMAFEGRSSAGGRRPKWLDSTSEIRLSDVVLASEAATLVFESRRFGDCAPYLYEQVELFPSRLPAPELSGFDMLAGALSRIRRADADSDRYDRSLLQGITGFARGLEDAFASMELVQTSTHSTQVLDAALIARARELHSRTPPSRPVRLLATLDMMRVSTGSLGLRLDDGGEVRGVVSEDGIGAAHSFLGKRVLVHGKAVYRASGRLLRIDVEAIEDGQDAPALWARVPEPIRGALTPQQLSGAGPRTGGVEAFFGRWPGDESEEELLASLREL